MATTKSFLTDPQILKGLTVCLDNVSLLKQGLFTGDVGNLISRIDCFITKSKRSLFLYAQNIDRINQLRRAVVQLKQMPISEGTNITPQSRTSNTTVTSHHQIGLSAKEKLRKPINTFIPTQQPNGTPIGLNNENGNDCFLNALRQFIYNTPIAQHVIPFLCPDTYPKTLEDFQNYQTQKMRTSMGGSKQVRTELMPPGRQDGQQDAHEALMQLFLSLDPKKNPLFNAIENIRSYDLQSLPHGIGYEDFTLDSQDSLKVSKAYPHTILNISKDETGPLAIEIKPIQGPVCRTMQEVWDNFTNPKFTRTEPSHTTDEDAYGAYLKESTSVRDDMLNNHRVVKLKTGEHKGKFKVIPDQIEEYFRFTDLPKHLVFSLKRFSYFGNHATKIEDLIDVNETFRLDHRHVKTGKAANFRIKAFIVQTGSTRSGHYYTYVLKGSQWYKCNDSHVSQVSKEDAKKAMGSAYAFYAQREGKVSQSRKLTVTPKIAVSQKSKSTAQRKLPDYLIDKPKIDSTMLPSAFKREELLIGTANQNEVKGGRNSCSAQALGFLAKVLNGEVVEDFSIQSMLEANAQKFQEIFTEQRNQISEVSFEEIGHQGVIDFVVKEIESTVTDYNVFQEHGIEKSALRSYLHRVSNRIIQKYQTFCLEKEKPSSMEAVITHLLNQCIQGNLTKVQLSESVQKFVKKDRASDSKRIESVQRLYSSAFSGETHNFFSVYPKYQSHFNSKQGMIVETVHLNADSQMREAIFGSILSQLKENFLVQRKENRVGAVIIINGYTYSVALITQTDGSILYQIYDSHGNPALTGKNQAFIFKTKDLIKAAQFLNELIVHYPNYVGSTTLESDDRNLLGYYILTPTTHITVYEKVEAVKNYALSKMHSLGSYGFSIVKFPFTITGAIGKWLSSGSN